MNDFLFQFQVSITHISACSTQRSDAEKLSVIMKKSINISAHYGGCICLVGPFIFP